MHQLCEANGIRYFHFLQPNQYLKDSKPMGQEEKTIAVTEKHPYRAAVEKGYPLLMEKGKLLRSKGVRFHDLTRVFKNKPQPMYVDDCCHVSKEANEYLGVVIGRQILEDLGGNLERIPGAEDRNHKPFPESLLISSLQKS